MAWTYWTTEHSSGDILLWEQVREWAAAAQERYRAVLNSSVAVVRVRGDSGATAGHRIATLTFETSSDGSTFTLRSWQSVVGHILGLGNWLRISDAEAGDRVTLTLSQLETDSTSGLGFSWGDVGNGILSAVELAMMRRAIQQLAIFEIDATKYTVTDEAFLTTDTSSESSIGAGYLADIVSQGDDAFGTASWTTVRAEVTITLPSVSWFAASQTVYVWRGSISSNAQIEADWDPAITADISIGASTDSVAFPYFTYPGSAVTTTTDELRELTFGGGTSLVVAIRTSDYGAGSFPPTATPPKVYSQVASFPFSSGSSIDDLIFLRPAFTHP